MTALTKQTEHHLLQHHYDFESFAQTMIQTHEGRFDQIFWACLSEYCSNTPQVIVDMGTGPGLLLKDLRQKYPESFLVGVEAQPAMLEHAQKILKTLNLQNYQMINHDLAVSHIKGLANESVDICICSMLLHELQVPTTLIDEMRRILKPEGTIVIYDWHRHNLPQYAPQNRPSTREEFTHFSEHCRYSREDFVYLFECSEFKVLETLVRKNGKHILMVAQKPV